MGKGAVPLDRQNVATYYDRLAPVYGDGAYFASRRAAVLALISDDLSKAHRILDLGCGNGAFSIEFTTQSPTALIVGADLSPQMLATAQRRCGDRVQFLKADACSLPCRAASFDFVFMSHVLLLVPDVDRCLTEVARCLSPGGKLVATIGSGAALNTVLSAPIRSLIRRFAARRLRTFDDEEGVARACRAAGLQPRTQAVPFSTDWNALEEWVRVRWLTTFDEPIRTIAKLWAKAMRRRDSRQTLQFTETLLIAAKPGDA